MTREPEPGGGEGSPCPGCGVVHDEPAIEVVLAPAALARLGELVEARRWRRLVVVDDANTAELLGDRVASDLIAAGHDVVQVTFSQRDGLLADEFALAGLRPALDGADCCVVVGSGTLTDIARYAAFLEKLPFCAVPTAASMDGYASGVAAMQFGGVKVSFEARPPLGIFALPAVVAAAPAEMTVWGLGDLLGKASASFDWRLGHAVTGEAWCPEIERRVLDPLRRCCAEVAGILGGEPAGVGVLLEGLIASGLAMAAQGNSRPASGSEHHCSHLWDLVAYRGLRSHAAHGLQVGYATGFTTALQAASLDGLEGTFVRAPGQADGEGARWLGAPSPELDRVRLAKAEAFSRYGPGWPPPPDQLAEARARLEEAADLAGPVARASRAAGIPAPAEGPFRAEPPFLGMGPAAMRATLRYANRLRNRFTVLDLLEAQARLDGLVDELLGA